MTKALESADLKAFKRKLDRQLRAERARFGRFWDMMEAQATLAVEPETEEAFGERIERQSRAARARLHWFFDTDHSTPCPK